MYTTTEYREYVICNNPFATKRPEVTLGFDSHEDAEAKAKELSRTEGDIRLFRYREIDAASRIVTGTETYRDGKRTYRSKGFKTLTNLRTR